MILVLRICFWMNISYDIIFTNMFANEYPILDPSSSTAVSLHRKTRGNHTQIPKDKKINISSVNIPFQHTNIQREIYLRQISKFQWERAQFVTNQTLSYSKVWMSKNFMINWIRASRFLSHCAIYDVLCIWSTTKQGKFRQLHCTQDRHVIVWKKISSMISNFGEYKAL